MSKEPDLVFRDEKKGETSDLLLTRLRSSSAFSRTLVTAGVLTGFFGFGSMSIVKADRLSATSGLKSSLSRKTNVQQLSKDQMLKKISSKLMHADECIPHSNWVREYQDHPYGNHTVHTNGCSTGSHTNNAGPEGPYPGGPGHWNECNEGTHSNSWPHTNNPEEHNWKNNHSVSPGTFPWIEPERMGKETDIVINIKEWDASKDYRQMSVLYELLGKHFALKAPGNPDIRIELDGVTYSSTSNSIHGFGAKISPDDRKKLASGVVYTLESLDSGKVPWVTTNATFTAP